MIKTKSVYAALEPDDGFRLLVMRKWPRGIGKERVDGWERDLGPSLDLLEDWQQQRIDWPEFTRRYEQEMAGKASLLSTLAERFRNETITLLCGCREEDRCHRSILRGLLSKTPPLRQH